MDIIKKLLPNVNHDVELTFNEQGTIINLLEKDIMKDDLTPNEMLYYGFYFHKRKDYDNAKNII